MQSPGVLPADWSGRNVLEIETERRSPSAQESYYHWRVAAIRRRSRAGSHTRAGRGWDPMFTDAQRRKEFGRTQCPERRVRTSSHRLRGFIRRFGKRAGEIGVQRGILRPSGVRIRKGCVMIFMTTVAVTGPGVACRSSQPRVGRAQSGQMKSGADECVDPLRA